MNSIHNKQELMQECSERGWQALSSSNYQLAEEAYKQAVDYAQILDDSISEAIYLSYLALALKEQGLLSEAKENLSQSMLLAEENALSRLFGHLYFLDASIDLTQGKENAALPKLWKALDESLANGDLQTAELTFGHLGEIFRNRGWLEQAIECYQHAAEKAELNGILANQMAWLGNLAQTYAEIGDLDSALPKFKQVLKMAREISDPCAESRCLASLGLAHFENGDLPKALKFLQEALTLAEEAHDLKAESCWLGNLANVQLRLGFSEDAKNCALKALELSRKTKDKKTEGAQLDTIGDCLSFEQKYEEALQHYTLALKTSLSVCDRLGERIYLANSGRALWRLGHLEEAYVNYCDAARIFEEQRGRIHTDNLKMPFASAGHEIYRDIISICLETNRRVEALEFVGRSKSRAMLDLLANSPIDISDLAHVDDATITKLMAKELELRNQIASLERMYDANDSSENSDQENKQDSTQDSSNGDLGNNTRKGVFNKTEEITSLYKQWHEVIDQLRRKHPNYTDLVSVEPLNFTELKELFNSKSVLKAEDAIIEFFVSGELFLVAAIWQGLEEPKINLLPKDKVDNLQQDILQFLEMSATEGWEVPLSLCKRLYRNLFEPILGSLPKFVERLVIVPHANLHRFPFAALHDGQNFLIEKFSLSILPSASLAKILGISPKEEEDPQYLISAISDYSATRKKNVDSNIDNTRQKELGIVSRSSGGLSDLSHTLEEAETVQNLVKESGAAVHILRDDQVKDGLSTQFARYSVIHFAGHAVFNPEAPLASGLVLSDGSILSAARILQDPSFRTRKGKLLVLSACETGVNKISSGDEIIGLARALFFAGMRNLVSSLWEVADRSTSQLMQDFHGYWKDGQISISNALRLAQCKALKDGQAVHAWASFIHMGID